MKQINLIATAILTIAFLCINLKSAHGIQTDQYSIGLWAGAKAASNIQVLPRGRQAEPAFNTLPDFGLRAYIPVDDTYNIHFVPEVYFSNYYFTTKDANLGTKYITEISGIIGSINLYFEGFEMGFGYGTVLSSDIADINTADDIDMQNIINFTFGYRYTFYTNDNGSLSAFARAEMLLNEIYTNYPKDDPLAEFIEPDFQVELQEQHNPRLAALTIGLSWDFDASSLFTDPPPRSRQ